MRVIITVIICLLVSSCSSQFAYRHLDWIILWYSDDYLELDRQQEHTLEAELSHLLQWHEQSELPKYRAQLQSILNDLTALPLSEAIITQHINIIFQHWQFMRNHISAQLPELISQLKPYQIDYLFKQLDERNQQRLNDYKELTAEEVKSEKLERMEEVLIDWLGSITSIQASLLLEFINKQQDTTVERIAYLKAYQQKLKITMQPPINNTLLLNILNHPDEFKSQEYKALQLSNRINTVAFIRDLSVHLQPEQISHLRNKIQDYINTINGILQASTKKATK
ncbi:MAG: hypothetical protein JXR16_16080 [Bermanella sp.]